MYPNFKGKDDLFLAVLDAEAQRRFPLHAELMLHAGFWTHASRRPELRRRVADQHERLLDTVGSLVEGWAGRWGFEFRLPPREVVRGIYAISPVMGLQALLADDPAAPEQFEDMFLAYAMGLIKKRSDRAAPAEGRLP